MKQTATPSRDLTECFDRVTRAGLLATLVMLSTAGVSCARDLSRDAAMKILNNHANRLLARGPGSPTRMSAERTGIGPRASTEDTITSAAPCSSRCRRMRAANIRSDCSMTDGGLKSRGEKAEGNRVIAEWGSEYTQRRPEPKRLESDLSRGPYDSQERPIPADQARALRRGTGQGPRSTRRDPLEVRGGRGHAPRSGTGALRPR